MKKKQARAVVERVLRNYKTKLGLARFYKQQHKILKYSEITEAIKTLLREVE